MTAGPDLTPTAKCSRCGVSAAEFTEFTVRPLPRSGRTILCNRCAGEIRGPLRCSFCNRVEAEVGKLVAGPEASICDACVATCVDVLAETHSRWAWLRRAKMLWRVLS